MKERVLELALFASAASEIEAMVEKNPERFSVGLETFRTVRRYYYRELVKSLLEYARQRGVYGR